MPASSNKHLVTVVIKAISDIDGATDDVKKQFREIGKELEDIGKRQDANATKQTDHQKALANELSNERKELDKIVDQRKRINAEHEKNNKFVKERAGLYKSLNSEISRSKENPREWVLQWKSATGEVEEYQVKTLTEGKKLAIKLNDEETRHRISNINKEEKARLNSILRQANAIKNSFNAQERAIEKNRRSQAEADAEAEKAIDERSAKWRKLAKDQTAAHKEDIKRSKEEIELEYEKARLREKYYKTLKKIKETQYSSDFDDVTLAKYNAELDKTRQDLEVIGAEWEDIDRLATRQTFNTRKFAKLQIAGLKEDLKLQEEKIANEEELSRIVKQRETDRLRAESRQFGFDRDRSLFDNLRRNLTAVKIRTRETDTEFARLRERFREGVRSGGALTRTLGRLGLAVRGLAIVGVISFFRALAASVSALVTAVVGLAGSLVNAAAALGGTFVAAAASALPVIGLLIAAFQRLSLIQEAVNQAELAKKNTFGDTGKQEQQAADNADQIAEANRGLKEAQEGVTDARKEAAEELRNLRLEERAAELQMQSSILSQADAQRALVKAIREGDVESIASSQLGVREARFGVRRSRYDLNQIRRERRDKSRRGVGGSEQVEEATKRVADAQRALADAHKSTAAAADTQVAAERNLAYALNQLTESERKLFKQFMNFKDRFRKAAQPITDVLIRAFSDAFRHVERLILDNDILKGMTSLAHVLGRQIRIIAKILTGSEFKSFWLEMMGLAERVLPIVRDGFIALARIFANIATGAAPALVKLLEFIVGGLEAFVEHTSDTKSVEEFFLIGVDHLIAWSRLLLSIIKLFGALMSISSDSQLGVVGDLTNTINGATEAVNKDKSGVRKFFEDAAKGLSYLGDIVVAVGAAFVELAGSDHVKALSDVIVKVLIPGFVQGVKFAGAFAIILDHIIEIPIVGEIFRLGVAFAFMAVSLNTVVLLFKPLYHFLKVLGPVFKKVYGILAGKGFGVGISSLTRYLAIIPKLVKGFGIVGIVIAVVIGAFEALRDNFLGITDIMGDAIDDLLDTFSGLGDAIGDLFNEVTGSNEGLSGFWKLLKRIGKVILDVISFVGKLVGSMALLTVFNAITIPLKGFANILTVIVRTIGRLIGAFKKLFSGEMSIKEFFMELADIAIDQITGIIKGVFNAFWGALQGVGKFMFNGLTEVLKGIFGRELAENIINSIIDIINWVIDRINEISPFGDIEHIDDFTFGPEKPILEDTAGQARVASRRAAHKDEDTKATERNTKAKKEATKYEKDYFNAQLLSGGASKGNARINNRVAESLNRTSRAHKKMLNFQDALTEGNRRARQAQARYAKAIERTGDAEARLARVINRTKNARKDYNEIGVHTIGINRKIRRSTKDKDDQQAKLNETVAYANLWQARYNLNVAKGGKHHEIYSKELKNTTNKTQEQVGAVKGLSNKYVDLNDVLKITGMNSRALGVVFKSVTNKLLTEFQVNPLKIELPTVSGMFKNADRFQAGGYFGNKRKRGPDDRLIQVAGGEAILTGHHQKQVDGAMNIASSMGYGYGNLDEMFAKDKRTHSSAPAFARGGRNDRRGRAGGRSIVIPKRVPDAMNALPGLDLMAWIASKYFGLSLGSGLRPGAITSSGNPSDHSWGGAIDIGNGITTPQMDAAWRWFAEVLGGGVPGGFVPFYTSGAIKQMIYRDGGDHMDHIHLALLPAYANNVELLTKLLTGKAVPVGTGGMFAAAPQLRRPKIKGSKGAPRNMLQGQANVLTKRANKMLNKKIRPALGGSPYATAPITDAIDPGTKIRTGYTVYDDPPPGAFGALDQGYAELGTATGSGLTGGGYLAQALGLSGELPENFPLDVTINGQTRRLYKRDRGWGQGTNAYGIDIWRDSWGFYGLDANSSGQAIAKVPGRGNRRRQRGGKIPAFDNGGIVPGKRGQPVLSYLHGGEVVLPTHKFGSGGRPPLAEKKPISELSVKFDGDLYNLSKISEFILYISDRIEKFANQIEIGMEEIAMATSKWTYKIKKNKTVIKVKNSEQEARRHLNDLRKEYDLILDALMEARKGRRKARGRIKALNRNFNKVENKLRRQIENTDDKDKKEELRDELKKARGRKKNRMQKLRGVVNKADNKIQELQQQRQEKIAEMYEAQIALFEESIAKFDDRLQLKDVKQQIAEIEGTDKEGNLTDEGRARINQILQGKRETLESKGAALQAEYNRAAAQGDQDRMRELRLAIEENKLALLENSQEIQELNDISEEIKEAYDKLISLLENQIQQLNTQIAIAELTYQDDQGELTEEGKGVITGLYNEIASVLEKQREEIEKALAEARAAEDQDESLIAELEQALLDNELALLQNTESIKDLSLSNIELYEKALSQIEGAVSFIDTTIAIVTAQNQDELGELTPAGVAAVDALLKQREEQLQAQAVAIQEEMQRIQGLEGQEERYQELVQALAENQLAIIENTESISDLYLSNIELYEKGITISNDAIQQIDTKIEIERLKNQTDQGDLTEEGKSIIEALLGEKANELLNQRGQIEAELARAQELNQIDRIRELEQALLDNELAMLQNTEAISELTEQGLFDFKTKNWQDFRQAILNGNGQLLPQWSAAIPQLHSGGYIRKGGLANLHTGERVIPASRIGSNTSNMGALVDTINFTQPMEVADPVAISNQIGFKLSTLKSI